MNYKKHTFWVFILAMLICVIVVVCFLFNPKQDSYGLQIVVPEESQNEQPVESGLPEEIISLPDDSGNSDNWVLDVTYTENCNNGLSIQELFGTVLGDYGAFLHLNDNGTIEYSIGAFTGKGTWYPDGDTGCYIAEVVVYPEERDEILTFYEFRESPESKTYLIFDYERYSFYWIRSAD